MKNIIWCLLISVSLPAYSDNSRTVAPARQAATAARPAAIPASEKEWADIQAFIRANWTAALAQEEACNKMLEVQKTALKSKDPMSVIMSSTITYHDQVLKLHISISKLKRPDASNADTAKFLERMAEHFNKSFSLEAEQSGLVISSMIKSDGAGFDEGMKKRKADIEKHRVLAVTYLQRIFWNYGYYGDDISAETMSLRPGAKPKPMVRFDRSDLG